MEQKTREKAEPGIVDAVDGIAGPKTLRDARPVDIFIKSANRLKRIFSSLKTIVGLSPDMKREQPIFGLLLLLPASLFGYV